MGSSSDWETMKEAVTMLEAFGIDYEASVVSAHRTPLAMVDFAKSARSKGIEIIIAVLVVRRTYREWSLR